MSRAPTLMALLIGLFLSLSPVAAQDAGRGLIIEGNPVGEANLGSLNPMLCWDASCRRLTGLLFPMLRRVDPQTRTFAPATADNGLVESWNVDGDTITFHLRADRHWSDGTPITAYDVYYSYLAAISDEVQSYYLIFLQSLVRSAAPLNLSTFAVTLNTPNCDAIDLITFPIIPAHVFDPNFADSTPFAGGNIDEWAASQPKTDFSALLVSPFNRKPTVTAGPFRFGSRAYDEAVRLISADGLRAFEYVNAPDYNETVNRFLRGEINLLVSPPYDRLEDLSASSDVTLIERPGNVVYSIRFNLADPQHPSSDRDEDGNPLDQGSHPILSDVAVRRAMKLGINVQAIMDSTIQGQGIALNGSYPPSSWAYDGATPPDFDPMSAARLLESAGWKDTNDDGIRECVTCTTAPHGSRLALPFLYNNGNTQHFISDFAIAAMISEQLHQVGIDLSLTGSDIVEADAVQQTFSIALISYDEIIPDTPDQSAKFTPVGDVLNTGNNYGSYRNDALTAIFDQALHVDTCDISTRAGLYAQAQQILRDDLPAIPLFSPNRIIAVRGDARALQPLVEEYLP